MDDAIGTNFYHKDLFTGWVPIRFYWSDSKPCVDWCYLGERRFVETSFSGTIESCLNQPFNQMFRHQTSIDVLRRFSKDCPGIYPTGFVFHISRCGASLVSQTLAALSQNIVLSEPDPIDSIIRSDFRSPEVTDEQRIDWLRWMVSALGQPRSRETNLFMTFNSWNATKLVLVRRAFPDVPWVFLYRDPIEVLASHLKYRPVFTVPGMIDPSVFGWDSTVFNLSPPEYCARILLALMVPGLANMEDQRCLLVNYAELPDAIQSSILPFMQVEFNQSDNATMTRVANLYSEQPEFKSESENHAKSLRDSDPVRQISEKMLRPMYDGLEEERQARRLASSS